MMTNHRIRTRLLACLAWVFFATSAVAQHQDAPPLFGPLNSDPLTERGISPRVLDIALYPMSQGIAFEMLVSYQAGGERGDDHERFRMVYDPDTEYGRDLHIEFENEPLRSTREYRRALEASMGSDYWVRQQAHLHDPGSVHVISSENGVDVISFRFDKTQVPTKQRWLLALEGRVYVEDRVLRRIDFVADDTIERDGIRHENFRTSVVFGAVPEHGGYLIDQIEEQYAFHSKDGLRHIHTHSRVTSYTHAQLGSIAWNHQPTELISNQVVTGKGGSTDVTLVKAAPEPVTRAALEEKFESSEVVKLDLHRALPLWADDVRKMGFELPKTYGISAIGMWQDGEFDITDVGVGGISAIGDIPLLERLGNKTKSTISTLQVRADFWLLPFLNLSLIGGTLETDSNVTLHFTPLFQSLYKLETGDDLPKYVTGPAATTASTLGAGLTTGFKYENMVMSVSATYAETVTNETNSEIDALVVVGMVGYDFGDMGLQIMSGIQYLDTDRTIMGQLDLGEGQGTLDFSVDLVIEETLFMAGFNKDIGRNWTLTGFAGINGTRKQGTLMFGYRW